MFCPNCGHQIPDESVYCPDCGCRIYDTKEEADQFNAVAQEAKNTASEYTKRFRHASRKVQIAVIAVAAAVIILMITVVGSSRRSSHSSYSSAGGFRNYSIVRQIYTDGEESDDMIDDLMNDPQKYLSEFNNTYWKVAISDAAPFVMSNNVLYADVLQTDVSQAIENEKNAWIELYNFDTLVYDGFQSSDGFEEDMFWQPGSSADQKLPLGRVILDFGGCYATFEIPGSAWVKFRIYDTSQEEITEDDPIEIQIDYEDRNIFVCSVDPNVDLDEFLPDYYSAMFGGSVDDLESKYGDVNYGAYEAVRNYSEHILIVSATESEFTDAYTKAVDYDKLQENSGGYDAAASIFARMFVSSFRQSAMLTTLPDGADIDRYQDYYEAFWNNTSEVQGAFQYEYCVRDIDQDGIPDIVWRRKGENDSTSWYYFSHNYFGYDHTVNGGVRSISTMQLTGMDASEMEQEIENLPDTDFYDLTDDSGLNVILDNAQANGLINTELTYE